MQPLSHLARMDFRKDLQPLAPYSQNVAFRGRNRFGKSENQFEWTNRGMKSEKNVCRTNNIQTEIRSMNRSDQPQTGKEKEKVHLKPLQSLKGS